MMFNFNVTGNNNNFYNHVDTVNNYYGGKNEYRPLYVFNNQPNVNITAGAVQEFNPD